ncbi:hypothetical protein A9179_04800 [Pseudomonas alcaligenes]|uniref:Uncharacterized protein n=1 Tax=Aquipseudomonas alcaligenes TaxID=43263 RepID=A0ABR7RXQ3_AQUAC|nr:hypothetical protein [Pseudomonas alcaligenes]MBC9249589.1 hypothetical protein [Pseudomonas alcaligenes]
MDINRFISLLVIAGYLVVNLTMQVDFFAGHDIFAKYQVATSAEQALQIAREAYYAKTAFLLILLILLALRVPFGLGFGVSFLAYALIMLAFFGLGRSTAIYLLAAGLLLGSYMLSHWRGSSPAT